MQATKDCISLETAKLLKDCRIENKYYFVECKITKEVMIYRGCEKWKNNWYYPSLYPAYSWQEILWEHVEEFFGKQSEENFSACAYVLCLLQQKKYQEADKYFREHCILISK